MQRGLVIFHPLAEIWASFTVGNMLFRRFFGLAHITHHVHQMALLAVPLLITTPPLLSPTQIFALNPFLRSDESDSQ